MNFFPKIFENLFIFYTFVSVYIVKSNYKLKFLGNAKKCEDTINFGISTLSFKMNTKGPVSIAQ